MASKKVEFHEDAALEYEAAFEWYLERSILAASKFAAALNRAIDYDCGGASTMAYGQ